MSVLQSSKRKLKDEINHNIIKKSKKIIHYYKSNPFRNYHCNDLDVLGDIENLMESYYILPNGDGLIFYHNKFSHVKNLINYNNIKTNKDQTENYPLKTSLSNNFLQQYITDFNYPKDFSLSSLDFITILPSNSNLNNDENEYSEYTTISEILFTTLNGDLLFYSVPHKLLNNSSYISAKIPLHSSDEYIADVKILGKKFRFKMLFLF